MPTVHVFNTLNETPDWNAHSLVVLFGDEPFFKRRVVESLQAYCEREVGFPPTTFDGETARWADVMDAVSTRSLFDEGGHRFVVVDPADAFVSAHRERLEDEVARTNTVGCLVLNVGTWPANTRLYKAVDKTALQIDCRLPLKKGGKSIDEKKLRDWLVTWCRTEHGLRLTADGATELLELTGQSLGTIHQELGKMELLLPKDSTVDIGEIRKMVGGWSQKTVWEIIDFALDGRTADAIAQLDHLLASDEPPQSVFAQVSYTLRRFAAAADAVARSQRQGGRVRLEDLLKGVGFREWPAGALKLAEQRLVRLGRERALSLHRVLLQTDLSLKGSHASPARGRDALELLFLRLGENSSATSTPSSS
ncbi:MAG: DNA polymerase III subunit delta [Planctomycetales bacterium]|nr:DNA polymerase III subunit delta [Planctomycetales bacterium]